VAVTERTEVRTAVMMANLTETILTELGLVVELIERIWEVG
jgi:hypothetical protein